MTKKNRFVTVMAFLALFWITIWIVWTWILILFTGGNTTWEQTLTPEQYAELQNLIESQSWTVIETWTGENIETWTGEEVWTWTGEEVWTWITE